MRYRQLGSTGLQVSELILGCMSFGIPARGAHPWTLDADRSRPIIKKALDLGFNCFDTANVYSDGTSEEIVGGALKDYAARDDVVIATKVYGRMREGPNGIGLSRKAILREVENSLRRLRTDYIDLYQIHFWDNTTPIEETLGALDAIVASGKVRYIGACNCYAWQFALALALSERNGLARFVSMQNHLNLMYREEEREMLPLCRAKGVAVVPFSPFARGQLIRDWDSGSARAETDLVTKRFYGDTSDADKRVVEAVAEVAKARGCSRSHVALAWLRQKSGVTAPIIGATKVAQLEDAVAGLDVELTSAEIESLERSYVPHAVVGLN